MEVSQFAGAVNRESRTYKQGRFAMKTEKAIIEEAKLFGNATTRVWAYIQTIVINRNVLDPERYIIVTDRDFYLKCDKFFKEILDVEKGVSELTIRRAIDKLKEIEWIKPYLSLDNKPVINKYIINEDYCRTGRKVLE